VHVRNLLWPLPSNSCCLQSHYLAAGLHADETGLFSSLKPNKALTFQDFCHGSTESKQWVTVLPTCNAGGGDKLVPLVTGKY
jgi:hypothetical protein